MLRQRILSISLIIWLILLFNIERYDLLGINLPTMLYIVSAAVVVAVIMVPDFVLIRWYVLLVPVALGYAAYRFITIENSTTIPSFLFIIVECAIIGVTFFLGWLISKQVADVERTYDSLVMNSENSRVLEPIKGEEVFNQELFRARQYDRPVSMLVVKPPTLREMEKLYSHNYMSYQISLQHRYIKSRIAQLSEALLYATDPITTHGDNVVICLPETSEEAAMTLSRRIAAVVHASLGITIHIGVVQITKEMPLFQDMLNTAENNMYAFIMPDQTGTETSPPKPPNFDDDDTMPIPYLDTEGNDTTPPHYKTSTIQAVPANAPVEFRPVSSAVDAYIEESNANDDDQESDDDDPTGATTVTEQDDVAESDDSSQKTTISAYEWLVATLLGVQIFPLEQLRISESSIAKVYYNPDFWVNRLPYQSSASRTIYGYIKRAMDVLLILLASPILVPACSLIALLIYVEDKGPVLYSQERTGLGNHKFKMWKFRSMIVDANNPEKLAELGVFRNERGETVDEDGNKLTDDPRITRIGKFIRKTSLDEIPQLWNIFVGDMSLVGPRPTSFGVEKYEMSQTHRLTVKPGLTGLWQVYDRGDTDFDNRIIWDMRYIDKMCLWMDIQILFLTVTRQVLKRRGA